VFCGKRHFTKSETKGWKNTLFDQLLALRHQVALKAGFENFRDYAFAAYGRFDYTAADCFKFHQAVAKAVVPVVAAFDRKRKQQLGLDKLRPWDTEVDVTGLPPLQPFVNSSELIDKTIACFNQIHPDFGGYISIMHKMGHFDLDSRKSKAPGGYNYPLPESGVPFIFMNSVGSVRDLVTMVHEGGHAIHSFLCTDLPLNDTKNVPAEFSELASMGMELISMEHWDVFFDTPEDLKRAKLEQLEKVVDALPWIAQIDKFQHWIYEHPKHSVEERRQAWMGLSAEFRSQVVDWTGLEAGSGYDWQRQLHLFEVPFYYIEYAFAQLGAIALWRNYKSNPQETIASYRKALGLGYTRSIGTLYQAAGIRFDFSEAYVSELVQFVLDEIGQLE
jgi:oligoendopeptidase F